MQKWIIATLLFVTFSGCAGRQITKDNNLPKKIMDSRVELNAELIGKPYAAASTVILWADAVPGKMQNGHFGNGGMIFHYNFDKSMKITIDGKEFVFNSAYPTNVDHMKFTNVPQATIQAMANAQEVQVDLTADKGQITFTSTFSKKNFMKFQEFVQKYILASQEVQRPSFLIRMMGVDSDDQ